MLGEVMAEDYRRHCQATPDAVVESLDDFRALLARWDEEIPDGTIEMKMLVAEGDLVGIWGVYSGTQQGPMGPFPATGKRVEADFGGVHRIADGKIVETWVTWDNVAILSQLGLFPPPPAPPEEVAVE
jgi:predicted ester cyclase